MTETEGALLAAARTGDGRAFDHLSAPFRRRLFAHCYRMLGSRHDAEDAVQETLLRAWRRIETYESRATFRGWLYAIATRVCLDALDRRGARRLPSLDGSAPDDPTRPPSPPVTDPIWIEPCPDALWDDGHATDANERETPESSYTRRESVSLAFLAAVHLLPPAQRAALLLREVMGWQATEVADALDTSVAAVNSSLQRARRTLDERADRWRERDLAVDAIESDTLARYVRAWETGDFDALAEVLRADVTLAMPPVASWYAGRDAVLGFFGGLTRNLGGTVHMTPATRTNGQPALMASRADAAGVARPEGLHVLTIDRAGRILGVMVFLGAHAM